MSIPRLSVGDPGSYSNPDEVVVTHMDLNLRVNFQNRAFVGHVVLTVYVKSKTAEKLILDTRDLHIERITTQNEKEELKYTIDEPVHTFGSKLTIQLPKLTSEKLQIKIQYRTDTKSTALQWLTAEQTAGGRHPYVFSMCQPDHVRSMVPCQDTSSVKGTYKAKITAPEELTVLMSAIEDGRPEVENNGNKTFHFHQPVPIPAYLIAIAIGNLESRKIGPRSHVWAEPEIVDSAASEFVETELFLKTAEDICGPYIWKKYDILVMPPSFPFGGMENPCLTFLTPTLLAGDRSQVSVVAHEIAHSWTGNLVSVKNYEHFWLNEGFTTFLERKIKTRNEEECNRHFLAIEGLKDLRQAIETLGEQSPLTKLVVDLTGVDPDDAFSTVPYEKGHTFLFYLEELVGGAEIFETFLRAYFSKFKYQSIETDDFKSFLLSYFSNNENVKSIDWNSWLYTPGMPLIIPNYDTKLQQVCTTLADRWHSWNENEPSTFTSNDLKQFNPDQIQEFCAILIERTPLSVTKLQLMNELYKLNDCKHSEIRYRWLRVCILSRWIEQVDLALTFVTEQGRMKYVHPILRDLFMWPETREKAYDVFQLNKSKMMHVLVVKLEGAYRSTSTEK